MKVSELKELFNQENIESVLNQIKVKQYISIGEKSLFIKNIIEQCITDNENRMMICDYLQKKIAIDLNFVLFYSDLELDSEDVVNDYDFLVENGIIKFIQEEIPESEKYLILDILHEEIGQQLNINNSMEVIFAKGVNDLTTIVYGLIDKIPDEKTVQKFIKSNIKLLPKIINEVKPETLTTIKSIIGNVKLGLNKEYK